MSIIATTERARSAQLFVSSESPGMPARNLQRPQPRDYYESVSTTGMFLDILLSSSAPIDLIALLYTNANEFTTWRIRSALSRALLSTGPLTDTGFISAIDWDPWARNHMVSKFDPQGAPWWRIDVIHAGQFRAGVLAIDGALSLPVKLGSFGHAPGRGSRRRQFDFSTPAQTEDDAYRLGQIERNVMSDNPRRVAAGPTLFTNESPVFFMADPSNRARVMDWSVYGVLDRAPSRYVDKQASTTPLISKTYTITELEHP